MRRYRWIDPDEVAELPCTPADDAAFDKRLRTLGIALVVLFVLALALHSCAPPTDADDFALYDDLGRRLVRVRIIRAELGDGSSIFFGGRTVDAWIPAAEMGG